MTWMKCENRELMGRGIYAVHNLCVYNTIIYINEKFTLSANIDPHNENDYSILFFFLAHCAHSSLYIRRVRCKNKQTLVRTATGIEIGARKRNTPAIECLRGQCLAEHNLFFSSLSPVFVVVKICSLPNARADRMFYKH